MVSTTERRFAQAKEEQRGVVQRVPRNGFTSTVCALFWWFCGSWVGATHWRRFGRSTNQQWRHWTKVVERTEEKKAEASWKEPLRAAYHFDQMGLQAVWFYSQYTHRSSDLFTVSAHEWTVHTRAWRLMKRCVSMRMKQLLMRLMKCARAWSMNSTKHAFGLMKRCVEKKRACVFQLFSALCFLSLCFHIL